MQGSSATPEGKVTPFGEVILRAAAIHQHGIEEAAEATGVIPLFMQALIDGRRSASMLPLRTLMKFEPYVAPLDLKLMDLVNIALGRAKPPALQ